MSVSAWLAGASSRLRTIWIPTVLVSGVAAVSVLLGGTREAEAGEDDELIPDNQALLDEAAPSGLVNLEQEIRAVLAEVKQSASARLVRFEFAVQPDLTVRADHGIFRQVLVALVSHASAQSPIGRVLVTGTRRGGRVQVAVVDDGAGTDVPRQAAALRSAETLLALQGATLEITAEEGEGSTLVARWPDASRDNRMAGETVAAEAPARDRMAGETMASHAQKILTN